MNNPTPTEILELILRRFDEGSLLLDDPEAPDGNEPIQDTIRRVLGSESPL